jgi:predicted 3-demethylubiquinone-9 3-methyltransferase (glyoxalase superfamily)
LHDGDEKKSGRVMQAMLQMQKIDIKALKDAYER